MSLLQLSRPSSARANSNRADGKYVWRVLLCRLNRITRELLSQTIRQGDFSTAQSYNYDSLNRLTTVLEQSSAVSQPSCVSDNSTPCQQFGYDRWGNRWVSASAHVPATVFEPTGSSNFTETNRLNLNGSTFDNAGSLKTIGGYSWAYDAEGRLVSSEFTANGITSSQSFVYDGEGRRVKKGATVYVYDALGQLAAEYNGVSNGSGVQYLTADHLGSTRLVVDGTTGLAVRRMDYLPFGMSLTAGYGSRQTTHGFETSEATASLAQRFTGKERDAETNLDYFGARYFSAPQGRFTSADPSGLYFANPTNPQSLNLYSYARNNPLKFTDPTGMYCYYGDDSYESNQDSSNYDFRSSKSSCEASGGQWTNDAATHQIKGGDWVDNDGRPEEYLFDAGVTTGPNQSAVTYGLGAGVDMITTVSYAMADIPIAISNSMTGMVTGSSGSTPYFRLFGGHWCGPGGGGSSIGGIDAACQAHDACYETAGLDASINTSSVSLTPAQAQAAQACNQALYDAARSHPGAPGSSLIQLWLVHGEQTPFGAVLAARTAAKPW